MTRTVGAAVGALLFVLFMASVAMQLSHSAPPRHQAAVAAR